MIDLVRCGVPPDFIASFLANNYKNTKLLRSIRKGIEKKNSKNLKDWKWRWIYDRAVYRTHLEKKFKRFNKKLFFYDSSRFFFDFSWTGEHNMFNMYMDALLVGNEEIFIKIGFKNYFFINVIRQF